jgi:hypothetical protein
MREPIGKLLGWRQDGCCRVFIFVDEFFDHGFHPMFRGRHCGVAGTELIGIDAAHHEWLTNTDDGLHYRFEDYEEMDGKSVAEIVAWGRQEIAEATAAGGDCYNRIYDTSYRETYWPLLRVAGFTEEQYLAFDCVGSWSLRYGIDHVSDPELLERVREWEALSGTPPVEGSVVA